MLGGSHSLFVDGPQYLELPLPTLFLLLVDLEDDDLVLFQRLPEQSDFAVFFLEQNFQFGHARVGRRLSSVRQRISAAVEILVQRGARRLLPHPLEPVTADDGASAQDGSDSSFLDHRRDGASVVFPATLERRRQQSRAAPVAAVHQRRALGDGRQAGPAASTAITAHQGFVVMDSGR